jgi:predicted TIM-barrel fold metal-dependent hydrolase
VPCLELAAFAVLALAGWSVSASGAEPLPAPFAIEAATSAPERAARSFGVAYRGPLFDTHAHLDPDGSHDVAMPSMVRDAMELAKVDRLILLPTPNAGRTRSIDTVIARMRELRDASHGDIALLCGGELTDWMNAALFAPGEAETARRMERLAAEVKAGCAGVGEIGFRHYDKTRMGAQWVIALPAGYPPLLAIARTAALARVPLDLHAEPVEPDGKRHESEVFGTIGLMLQGNPELRLILAHTAMTNARNARALLAAYPTLMMNVNFAKHRHGMWQGLEPVSDASGRLYTDWAALFEEMPERFMVGSDMFFSRVGDPEDDYRRRIRNVRRCLGSLAPQAARRIAYENAARVYAGSTMSVQR